jgi:hypothetical protein
MRAWVDIVGYSPGETSEFDHSEMDEFLLTPLEN